MVFKVKCHLHCFGVKVKDKAKGQSCKLNVWHKVVGISDSACRVYKKSITLKFAAEHDNYQSQEFVYVYNQDTYAN